jgi:hypothetical protein
MKDGQLEHNRLYTTLYCSLCAALRKNNNMLFTLFVNSEVTLILLSLEEYINTKTVRLFCPKFFKKKFKRKPAYAHDAINRAADISAMLGWLHAIDFCTDRIAQPLTRAVTPQIEKLLRHTLYGLGAATQKIITEYATLTRENTHDFDLIQSKSYEFSRQLYMEIAGKTAIPPDKMEQNARLFGLIGQCIALLDPLLDIEEDIAGNSFNPIIAKSDKEKAPLSHAYGTFLEAYQAVAQDIKKLFAVEAGLFHKTLVYAVNQGLDNNAGKIKRTAERFFKADK